jgi:hypothetical protein
MPKPQTWGFGKATGMLIQADNFRRIGNDTGLITIIWGPDPIFAKMMDAEKYSVD